MRFSQMACTMTILLITSWIAFVNSLPFVSDMQINTGATLSSKDFKNTDQLCQWLLQRWIQSLMGHGFKSSKEGRLKDPVVSHKSKRLSNVRLLTVCADDRTAATIKADIDTGHGQAELGPFYLECDKSTEIANLRKISRGYGPIKSGHYRIIGVCEPKSGTGEAASSSIGVPAGGTACLDSESTRYSNLVAYLEADNGEDGGWDYGDPVGAYLQISELGTLRTEYVTDKNVVSISVDHSQNSVYRACAKQQAGHGNAILRFAAFDP